MRASTNACGRWPRVTGDRATRISGYQTPAAAVFRPRRNGARSRQPSPEGIATAGCKGRHRMSQQPTPVDPGEDPEPGRAPSEQPEHSPEAPQDPRPPVEPDPHAPGVPGRA